MSKLFYILSCSLLLSFQSFAQDLKKSSITKERPSPLSSFNSKQKRMYDLLSLELDMAEAGNELSPSEKTKQKLTLVYEKMTSLQCMPLLNKELNYKGKPEDSKCLYYLTKLETLQATNPVALCARNGINSEACTKAYDNQYIDTFDKNKFNKESIDSVDLDAKLASYENKKNIFDLESQVKENVRQYRKEQNSKIFDTVVESYNKLISKACSVIHHKIHDKQPSEKLKASFKRSKGEKKEDNELKDLIKEFSKQTESQAIKPEKTEEEKSEYWRVRYLSRDCLSAIDQAISFDKFMTTPNCYREGFQSPICIQLMRRDSYKKKKKNYSVRQKKNPQKPLFGSF